MTLRRRILKKILRGTKFYFRLGPKILGPALEETRPSPWSSLPSSSSRAPSTAPPHCRSSSAVAPASAPPDQLFPLPPAPRHRRRAQASGRPPPCPSPSSSFLFSFLPFLSVSLSQSSLVRPQVAAWTGSPQASLSTSIRVTDRPSRPDLEGIEPRCRFPSSPSPLLPRDPLPRPPLHRAPPLARSARLPCITAVGCSRTQPAALPRGPPAPRAQLPLQAGLPSFPPTWAEAQLGERPRDRSKISYVHRGSKLDSFDSKVVQELMSDCDSSNDNNEDAELEGCIFLATGFAW